MGKIWRHIKSQSAVLAVVCFLILAATFSAGFFHADEHWQILEFAAYKLGINPGPLEQTLPWEYSAQMRATFQPALVVLFYKILDFVGSSNPFVLATFLRFLSAGLTFWALRLMHKAFAHRYTNSDRLNWFLPLSFLLWFGIYHGVRFSSENWSGSLFCAAFALYFIQKYKTTKSTNRPAPQFLHFTSLGALLGVGFLCRYQIGLMILGFGLWLVVIQREKWRNLFSMAFGFLILFGLGILVDRWFYGNWTLSIWAYIDQNIVQDKASTFGTKHWIYYIYDGIRRGVPPASVLYVLALLSLVIFRVKHAATWAILPFVLVHHFIGHKELRFLFPIFGLLPFALMEFFEVLRSRVNFDVQKIKPARIFARILWVVNLLVLLVACFKPADDKIGLYRTIYEDQSDIVNVYGLNENPYTRISGIYYYKRPQIRPATVSLSQLDSLDHEKAYLLCLHKDALPAQFESNATLIYQTYPKWLLKFNIGGWIERSNQWRVYRIEPRY